METKTSPVKKANLVHRENLTSCLMFDRICKICRVNKIGPADDTRHLYIFELTESEIAIARVAARVAQGGHNVASAVVRRALNLVYGSFKTFIWSW